MSSWRSDDDALLARLEDELLATDLFALLTGGTSHPVHPRAGGLVAELRRLPGGAEVVARGDAARLAAFVEGLALATLPPVLLHHLAVFSGNVGEVLASHAPERAADAWVRALACWIALGIERSYLGALADALLGPKDADARIPPERVASELLGTIARHAETTARELGTAGRAALLALARAGEAAERAGAPAAVAERIRSEAERHRNAAVESALAPTGDALEEASVRSTRQRESPVLLLRAIAVWGWTGNDEAVEHFVVEQVEKLGWELYRARAWDELRALLAPYRPLFESLGARIAGDPHRIAYAAPAAQMFVFLAEVESAQPQKVILAERAIAICPTHRNGRLVLAAFLCHDAQALLRSMPLLGGAEQLARAEALVARADALYPRATELEQTRSLLEAVQKRMR